MAVGIKAHQEETDRGSIAIASRRSLPPQSPLRSSVRRSADRVLVGIRHDGLSERTGPIYTSVATT